MDRGVALAPPPLHQHPTIGADPGVALADGAGDLGRRFVYSVPPCQKEVIVRTVRLSEWNFHSNSSDRFQPLERPERESHRPRRSMVRFGAPAGWISVLDHPPDTLPTAPTERD